MQLRSSFTFNTGNMRRIFRRELTFIANEEKKSKLKLLNKKKKNLKKKQKKVA